MSPARTEASPICPSRRAPEGVRAALPPLSGGVSPRASAAVEDAVEQVTTADVLVVASPTYKGTYTGLLKVFLDRLPHQGLAGTVAFPLLVMRLPQHALAVEVHLRPLLVELGATVPTPGLAVLEPDLDALDEVLWPWAARVAGDLSEVAVA